MPDEIEYIKMPRKDFEKLLKDLTDIINLLIEENTRLIKEKQ